MKRSPILTMILGLICLAFVGCEGQEEEHHVEAHKILATSPVKPVTLTQPYVCQIHSQRHIDVRAMEMGYLEPITIKEGQQVKENDVLFTVIPLIYQARFNAEQAEATLAGLEYKYTQKLYDDKVVADTEVKLNKAKLDKAQAKADLAFAELNFAKVKAPFDGIVDRLHHFHGSLVQEGEILTTMSDNSVMWVYFNVPEKDYLEYMTDEHKDERKIELMLASGNKFDHPATNVVVEADFNNENGNIMFRADFPNPERLLRHGQTGTILISRVQKDSLVIPQRATFEVLQKRYVFVIDKDNIAHQREISIENELEDLFVIKSGVVGVDDKIVLEGIRQVHEGDKCDCEVKEPKELAGRLKYHAE